MIEQQVASSRAGSALAIELLSALAISVVALAIFLNGSLLSWTAPAIDFSINYTAAHAIRDGENPYGYDTLRERAEALDSPTDLIYSQLFTSYIQPPTSATAVLPLTLLPWREATQVFLVLNHVFLVAAIAIVLATVRPSLPRHWVVAGVCVLLAAYTQINASFSLGQWDALFALLLAIAYWAYCRDRPAVAGVAIALGAAIKLIPGLLLLYLLWKREYRAVAWAAVAGVAFFAVSYAVVGYDVWHTYLTETLPALMKGSSQYSNAGFGALIARAHTPEVIRDLPEMLYLSEVPGTTAGRLQSMTVLLTALAVLAFVIPGRYLAVEARRPERLLWEFYLVVTAGLLISSVTWDFYVLWLLPVYAAVFLAATRVLPAGPLRWGLLAAFALALILMNYPGDFYLLGRNDFFYHPDWVAGTWVENRVGLYANHLDAVLFLRLPALLLFAGLCALLVLRNRRELDPARHPQR